LFGLVFIKKVTNQFFKKIETELAQTDRFRFGYFRTKTCFFPVWLDFSGLAQFFPVWLGFFFPVWVQFNFFGFRLIKPKPNRTEPVGCLKILIGLIGFFSWFYFFDYFFSGFLGLIGFLIFLLTPTIKIP